MDYSEQIKNKKWILKSKEIKLRDEKCQVCGSKKDLNVHHIYYIKGLDYWEYPDNLLITLCKECHKREHYYKNLFNSTIKEALNGGMFYMDLINKLNLHTFI